MKNIVILGATGSIGTQTLDVIRKEKDVFCLKAVSANTNYEKIIQIINEFNVPYVALMNKLAYEKVIDFCKINNLKTTVLYGLDGLNTIACLAEADLVVTSVVGMIGLIPTMNAIKAKKNIALANKETLVVAGELVKKEAKINNIKILPVDSEHGAIFQCLQGNEKKDIKNIWLTASGGPFRGKTIYDLKNIKPEQALKHPNWKMGKKISIDSSTLVNKGLEVIEAHWLFDVNYDNIKVIVHPESIVHSMIEYIDGSIIAELAQPDMRLPIQYALNYPKRQKSLIKNLNFYELNKLTFEKPDTKTFKCLSLAYKAGKAGGLMPTIFNGANEASVDLYLNNKISYLKIGDLIEQSLNKFENKSNISLQDIIDTDKKVKKYLYNIYQ